MDQPRLALSRDQILSYRRQVGALDQRLPAGANSLRIAAWAGLQDSMPRAALLSIHARVDGTPPTILDDPSLVQVWGPRYSVFVVAAVDRAVFTIGRMPEDDKAKRRAEDLASRIANELGSDERSFADVGRAIGVNPNALRYATTTGAILVDWDGARRPTIRTVPVPNVDPEHARLELARRHLHIFGPATPKSFAGWAGIKSSSANRAFDDLQPSLTPVTTPIGQAWILTPDEQTVRGPTVAPNSVRLLPSGDAYYLLKGDDRTLLVPDASKRNLLWTSRVWPGAVLARGEIIGTWRRAQNKVTIDPWGPVGTPLRNAIEAEATSLPLVGEFEEFQVAWS